MPSDPQQPLGPLRALARASASAVAVAVTVALAIWPATAWGQKADKAAASAPNAAEAGNATTTSNGTANPSPDPAANRSLLPPPSPPLPTINPARDQGDLAKQGSERPADLAGAVGAAPADVYSPSWWGSTRPTFEVHGYFRTRANLFNNFALGRRDVPGNSANLWPQPLDNSYLGLGGQNYIVTQTGCPLGKAGCPTGQIYYNNNQISADLRLRLNPEIVISDNLRILSQVDLLDNLILGSTPDSYAMEPSTTPQTTSSGQPVNNASGYTSAGYNPYAPTSFFSTTQGPPTAGVNGFQNSVQVNRVWAEYKTPVGQIRFGRMGSQWGLGMVANAGDGIDSDYQSTIDRFMFITGAPSLDLYVGGAYDFVDSGTNNSNPYTIYGGEPYSNASFTNVGEGVLFAVHRVAPDKAKAILQHGGLVLNGGFYGVYREQKLDVQAGTTPYTDNTACGTATCNNGLSFRGASAFIPDLWVQALWNKLRVEGEFAAIIGKIDNTPNSAQVPTLVREYGLVTESEYKMLEDKLHLNFGFGWASGDPWAPSLNPGPNGLQPEGNVNGPISTFRFHPDYRIDLIFFRQILTRVEGAYYFRPSVDYDFIRQPNGQKFGGGGALIWSRASDFAETPGYARDLGVETDFQLYYQASDGSLNDDPDKLGGFYAMVQYGVFFPLAGLGYPPGEAGLSENKGLNLSLSTAQTARLFLGIVF